MTEKAPVFALKNARLAFGNRVLFEDVSLFINKGDKICLIGRNGSGKSTLLKLIKGELVCDEGFYFIGPDTRVSLMPQEEDLSAYGSLREAVLAGLTTPSDAYKADILIETFALKDTLSPQTAVVNQLNTALTNPEIYGDTKKLFETTEKLHQAQVVLEELETKWLELQLLAES